MNAFVQIYCAKTISLSLDRLVFAKTMRKFAYWLVVSITLALVSTFLSWQHLERVSSEGLFSLYQGPTYYAHGWPWWFWRMFENGISEFHIPFFLLDVVFWFLVMASVVACIFYLIPGLCKLIRP